MNSIKLSELTFHAIVETTPSAIVLINSEGKISYINSQTEKLFGYSRSELIGQLIEILIPQRFKENHPNFRKMFFNNPSTRSMGENRELFATRKNGTEFPVEIGLNPMVTADGTLVLASIIDITERKKADMRFKLVVESAPNAMILVNRLGEITMVNNQTEKLFGYSKAELIGEKLEMLIPDRFKKHHPNHRNLYFETSTVRSMGAGRDLYALNKYGEEVPVEIGLNPIENEDEPMVLASIIDITERKIQEKIINEQVSELELKNKELEHFAFITSHDLQEPLRTVANFIKIIEEDASSLDEKTLEYLSVINQATNRMSVLVKAILDFSHLGKNKVLVKSDLNLLLDEVVLDLDNLIKSTNTLIKIDPLPTINIYQLELRQLFQNLISNAIKFSKKNVQPEITISYQNVDGEMLFSVKDNGIGVESKYYERIFNIFQRLHSEKDYSGNGIGLANCKKIVELHGGKIWIESEHNNGSTFYFTLKKIN
ncbi:MAG: PAS domain S-box protein [Bacteroidota bacterium]